MTRSPEPCRRCRRRYEQPAGPADPLCPACREQVAHWSSDERLSALAQQGFEEAMGMRLPEPRQFPGLPADAGLRAHRSWAGVPIASQQVTSWPDGEMAISEAPADYVIEPGQVRCRHCAAAITARPDGTWADASLSASCFSLNVPHAPLPPGLDGGAA